MPLVRITGDAALAALRNEIESIVIDKKNKRQKFVYQLLTQDQWLDLHNDRLFNIEIVDRSMSPRCFGARRMELSMYLGYQQEGPLKDGAQDLQGKDIDLISYHLLKKVWTNGIISCFVESTQNLKMGEGSSAIITVLQLILDYMPEDMG